jgi:hypothetical protein
MNCTTDDDKLKKKEKKKSSVYLNTLSPNTQARTKEKVRQKIEEEAQISVSI